MSPERAIGDRRPGQAEPSPPGVWPEGFAARTRDRAALLVLAHLESLTPGQLHRLAWREGTASGCLAAVRGGRVSTDGDRARAEQVDPRGVLERLHQVGARMVCPGDAEYPEMLLDLPDPPAWLFLRGRPTVGLPLAVGIVGARSCSPYGEEVARALGAGLAAAGVVVISGAARGVDAGAHLGALRTSGSTAAVLGSGIDVAYPPGNRDLIERIADRGTVFSEYPPGVKTHPRRFPARNRIVAALSRAVVVVEGAEGSGSLITAEFAGDLGREVMAVPGSITGPLSIAPNELIRDGATVVTSVADVLAALGVPERPRGPTEASHPSVLPEPSAAPTDLEREVLSRLPGSPVTLDALVGTAALDPATALRALAGLELKGLVRAEGGRYRRAGGGGPGDEL